MAPKTVGGILVVGLIIAFSLLAGCTNELDNNSEKECTITDYGNGVYYFGCTEANFANELSSFIQEHKKTHVVAMTAVTESFGHTDPIKGYFVITETEE